MAKHLIILKCDGNCPYNSGAYWNWQRGRRWCKGVGRGMKQIPKGTFNDFPEFCPLEDYEIEHCSKIQLKKKKMQDHIKRRKRCRK